MSNDGPNAPFLATPDSEATISNGRTGAVVATTTDQKGVLTAKIAAASGDLIHIMLADPEFLSATSDFITFTVP